MQTPKGYYREEYAPNGQRFRASGEFRRPRMGEYYLSGAEVHVYQAHVNLNGCYWIAVPVCLETCPACLGLGRVEVYPVNGQNPTAKILQNFLKTA